MTSNPQTTPKQMIDWLYKTVHHLPTSDVEIGMAIRDYIEELEKGNLHLKEENVRLIRAEISASEKSDQEMERVKSCEHIAEGDEGWEVLRDLCPSTAAVAHLRDSHNALLKTLQIIDELNNKANSDTVDTSLNKAGQLARAAIAKVRSDA